MVIFTMKKTLLFIRHGQTDFNVARRLPGQMLGVSLNETGRKQARDLSETLASYPITDVISSPLERAIDTAKLVMGEREYRLHLEPGLMDTNTGHWDGKLIADLEQHDPEWLAFKQNPTVAPAGVETFPMVQRRVIAAVEAWCLRSDTGSCPA